MNSRFATMSETASKTTHAVTETFESHPISTAMVVFGTGLGLGVLAGVLIADATLSRSSRPVEDFGYRMLDRLGAVMPDFASTFSSR
jgi:hypothetical protein